MTTRRILWVVFYLLMVIVAGFLGYQGFQSFTHSHVVVEWSTASELNTVGFNLLRSESPKGPFTQVNASIIPSSSDPLTGGSYRFDDHDVTGGKVYYYQLEEVEASGIPSKVGTIEVKAEQGGGVEIATAIVLAVAGLAGAGWVLLRGRKAAPLEGQHAGEGADG